MAQNLPVKQTSSYWTIRSPLIDNSMYLSTQGLNPVIAVVDKSYSGSDYYFLNEYSVDFTVVDLYPSIVILAWSLARSDEIDLSAIAVKREILQFVIAYCSIDL